MNGKPDSSGRLRLLIGLLLVSYVAVFVFLWTTGLFELDATTSDARVVAAVLGLLGGVFAASLTLIGVLLNFSLGERNLQLHRETEKRLDAENQRAQARLDADSRAANDRLQVEAATKAVELLTVADGQVAPPNRQAGALFILASLGQHELALALLGESWPARGVSSTAATWIIDRVLRRPVADDDKDLANLQVEAAQILLSNVDQLVADDPRDGPIFPPCAIGEWPGSAHWWARRLLLAAELRAMARCKREEWGEPMIVSFRADLERVRDEDDDPDVSGAARLVLAFIDGDADEPTSLADFTTSTTLLEAFDALREVWNADPSIPSPHVAGSPSPAVTAVAPAPDRD